MKDNKNWKDKKHEAPKQEHNKPQAPMSNPQEKSHSWPQNWPKKKAQ